LKVAIDLGVRMAAKMSLDRCLMDHHQVNGRTGKSSRANGRRCYHTHSPLTVIMAHLITVLLIMADILMAGTMVGHIVMVLITTIQTTRLGNNGPEITTTGPRTCQIPSVLEDKAGNSTDAKSSKTAKTSLKEEPETLSLPKSP